MQNLKQKTVSGFKWLIVNQIGQRLIRIVSFAILARILNPSIFGLFAMAFIAIDGFSIIKNMGIDAALIQRPEGEDFEKTKHTAFWLIQIVGVCIFLACLFSAPVAGRMLHNDEVVTLIQILGLVFIISNLGKIPMVMLSRKMRFKVISMIEMIAAMINSVTAVILALIWPNVWSLVIAYLLKQIVTAVWAWYHEPYRVRAIFDWRIASELFHFGKFLFGSACISYALLNVDNIVVGRFLGAAALGYYVLARNIAAFADLNVIRHISRVFFPAVASIQDDPEAVKASFLKIVRFISMISIPIACVLLIMPAELVRVLYGEKWLSIVPLIQVIAITQLIAPLLGCAWPLFNGCGRPEYGFRTSTLRLILKVPILLYMTIKFGLMGVVYSNLVLFIIIFPIVYHLCRKITSFSHLEFIKQIMPAATSALAMAVVLVLVKELVALRPMVGFHHAIVLALLGFFALAGYTATFWVIDRKAVKEAVKLAVPVRS